MTEKISVKEAEALFYRKIMLYHDLHTCLKNEQEALVACDLDRLWQISEEKNELCVQIQSVRTDILSLIDPPVDGGSASIEQVVGQLPSDRKAVFQKLCRSITQLKFDVEILRRDNIQFMDESLKFIDEMVSILSGQADSGDVYTGNRRLKHSGGNRLLFREV